MSTQNIASFDELRNQLKEESLSEPHFWVVIDYKKEPSHPDLANGVMYFHNDGDVTEFHNSKQLLAFLDERIPYWRRDIESFDIEESDFEDLWEVVVKAFNEYGGFGEYPYTHNRFVVPDLLFLTEKEAVSYFRSHRGHYSVHAHIEKNEIQKDKLAYRVIQAFIEMM